MLLLSGDSSMQWRGAGNGNSQRSAGPLAMWQRLCCPLSVTRRPGRSDTDRTLLSHIPLNTLERRTYSVHKLTLTISSSNAKPKQPHTSSADRINILLLLLLLLFYSYTWYIHSYANLLSSLLALLDIAPRVESLIFSNFVKKLRLRF